MVKASVGAILTFFSITGMDECALNAERPLLLQKEKRSYKNTAVFDMNTRYALISGDDDDNL